MPIRRVAVITLFTLAGCLQPTVEKEPPSVYPPLKITSEPAPTELEAPGVQAASPQREAQLAPQCQAGTQACEVDADCCQGLFCLNDTYAPAVCTPPQPDGAVCTRDPQCESGHCIDFACGSVCRATGQACSGQGDCCAGSYCLLWTYASWQCAPKLSAGEECYVDLQCADGVCEQGKCGAACAPAGDSCNADADCCAGTFCFNYTYAPAVCQALLPGGSRCIHAAHCQSQQCVTGHCAP